MLLVPTEYDTKSSGLLLKSLSRGIPVKDKTGALDHRVAEIAALKEAVRHGKDQENVEKIGGKDWVSINGKAVLDRWAAHFTSQFCFMQQKIKEAGMEIIKEEDDSFWDFERYQCPRWTTNDFTKSSFFKRKIEYNDIEVCQI